MIRYGDKVQVKAKFIDTLAAKIIFEYEIFNLTTGKLATTGRSEQAFLDRNYELSLYPPPFYLEWKTKHL